MRSTIEENNFYLWNLENYQVHATNKICGVKRKCTWNELCNIHVTKNVTFDLMHDLSEDVLRCDMAICGLSFLNFQNLIEAIEYPKLN